MKPVSKITLAVSELMARPEGCSAREVILVVPDAKYSTVQACFQRLIQYKHPIFSRNGIDGSGIRCSRYFTTKAAADAYVFTPGYYADRANWANYSTEKYLAIIEANPAVTYAEVAALIQRTPNGAGKTLGILAQKSLVFTARKMCAVKRRPVFVLFTTAAARDEWQAANPLVTLGHRTPGWRGEPKPKAAKTPKESKVKATRSPKKNVKRSALSVVKRKDSKIAEVRLGLSRKAFEVVKPKGDNIAIPHSAAQKVTVREGYPDHRFWVDPASVPRFSYGSGVAA